MIDTPYVKAVVATPNLQALYALDEFTGTAASAVGVFGGFAGLVQGTPARTNGPLANISAIAFDGVDDAVQFNAALANYLGAQAMTCEIWMRVAAVHATNFNRITSHEFSDGAAQGWDMELLPGSHPNAGSFAMERRLDNVLNSAVSPVVPLNVWSHAVGTFSGTSILAWVNGVAGAAGPSTFRMKDMSGTQFYVGRSSSAATSFLAADMAFIALYDRALDAREIATHYLLGKLPQKFWGRCWNQGLMVTPSNTVDGPFPAADTPFGLFEALYIGGAGDVVVVQANGQAVTFTAVPAGTVLPVKGRRVNFTNTSATGIGALRKV